MELSYSGDPKILSDGIHLYVSALINRYLLQYQADPDVFFAKKDVIRREMKQYLDLFLYGILERRNA
jgi:hypothetical protein